MYLLTDTFLSSELRILRKSLGECFLLASPLVAVRQIDGLFLVPDTSIRQIELFFVIPHGTRNFN
jgi:hypothetical protein